MAIWISSEGVSSKPCDWKIDENMVYSQIVCFSRTMMIIQWIEGYPIVSDKPILYLLFTRVYPCFKVDEGLPEIGTRCFWMWRMWMPGAVSSWGSFLKKLSHTLRLLNSLLWKMVRWFMMIYDDLWWFMMIYDKLW